MQAYGLHCTFHMICNTPLEKCINFVRYVSSTLECSSNILGLYQFLCTFVLSLSISVPLARGSMEVGPTFPTMVDISWWHISAAVVGTDMEQILPYSALPG